MKILNNNEITVEGSYAFITVVRKNKERISFKIDKEDVELLSKYQWCVQGNDSKSTSNYYAITNAKTKAGTHTTIKMHQLLCPTVPHQVVDHINGDTTDNRKGNLRAVSTRINSCNSRHRYRTSSTEIKGVYSRHQGKYYAAINCGNKILQTRQYSTIEEASYARYVLVSLCYPVTPPDTDMSWDGKVDTTKQGIILKELSLKFKRFIV